MACCLFSVLVHVAVTGTPCKMALNVHVGGLKFRERIEEVTWIYEILLALLSPHMVPLVVTVRVNCGY